MLRSLKNRLRQLWLQCELFESLQGTPGSVEIPDAETSRRPRPKWTPVPPRKPSRPRKGKKAATTVLGNRTVVRPTNKRPRAPRTHPQDQPFVDRLAEAFEQYNTDLFHGELRPVMLRVSRRMKNRLGHYMAATPSGLPAEIAISRRHIRRDTWDEVLHTLVHEMVHQWQDENGLPIDHGQQFRRKAREVGISARATRRVTPELGN